MDLVEGGDVRTLFSDAELLGIAAAEESHATQKPSGHRRGNKGFKGAAGAATSGGQKSRSGAVAPFSATDEASGAVEGSGAAVSAATGKPEVCMPHKLLVPAHLYNA